MKSIREFQNNSISESEKQKITGGYLVNWSAICAGLYTIVGQAHISGDKDMASAAWAAWTSGGCYA